MIAHANIFFMCFFVLLNLGYLALNLLALIALNRRQAEIFLDQLPQVFSGHEPAISVLVPAYNEEATISGSVRSLLQLSYPEYEIIVINDGSKDGTLEALVSEFRSNASPRLTMPRYGLPRCCRSGAQSAIRSLK